VGGAYLGCVGIQSAIVNVQAERDGTGEPKILARRAHLGVTEEKDHGDQSTNDHGSPSTPKPARATHEARNHWAKDGASVVDGIVAPRDVLAGLPEAGPARGQICRKEDVVERICQADQEP
jgi:hypothetical protein